jgi:predicted double-glycine peptidase
MKKRIRRTMLCILVGLAVVNTSVPVYAFSVDVTSMSCGAKEATPEEMKAAEMETLWDDTSWDEEEGDRATMEWYATNMTYFGQEMAYSCGPASVKMILKSITGSTYSESVIRNNTNFDPTSGTALVDLVSYINQEQNYNSYSRKYGQTKANMNTHLLRSIKVNDAPAIIGVVESASSGFPYNSTYGHFIVVYAYKSTKDSAIVCDPWAGYVSDPTNERYEISTDDLYDGYDSVNCGYGADITIF